MSAQDCKMKKELERILSSKCFHCETRMQEIHPLTPRQRLVEIAKLCKQVNVCGK
jgi:hypothetical protein